MFYTRRGLKAAVITHSVYMRRFFVGWDLIFCFVKKRARTHPSATFTRVWARFHLRDVILYRDLLAIRAQVKGDCAEHRALFTDEANAVKSNEYLVKRQRKQPFVRFSTIRSCRDARILRTRAFRTSLLSHLEPSYPSSTFNMKNSCAELPRGSKWM